MLIYNAAVHTVNKDNDVLRNGFVKFEDGKITAVGVVSDCPTVSDGDFDACGANLYPGFIDAHSHVGVWEDGEGVEGDDGNETTDPCTPHLRAIDMINPADYCFTEAASAGITTVMCGPGSANCISGSFTVLKTHGSLDIGKRIMRTPAAMKFSFGENPKMVYREKGESPVTRMATAAIIREQLYKAKRYLESVDLHLSDPDNNDLPDYDIKCEALLPLLRGEITAHAHCHRADDIFTAVRILHTEFGLKLVLIHATESAMIADELCEYGIPAIIGPILCDRSKRELANLTIKTAGILADKGVEFAICSDHPVIPVQYLPLTAGLAIRGGLSEWQALRTITIDAARLCGTDDRIGSIEIGKDADFAIIDGDYYDVRKTPSAVFIGGKQINTSHTPDRERKY